MWILGGMAVVLGTIVYVHIRSDLYENGRIHTDRLQPVGSNRPRLVRVTVRFGEPIDVRGAYDGVPPGRARREITDRVMAEIQRLTGQEPAGVYNDRAPDA